MLLLDYQRTRELEFVNHLPVLFVAAAAHEHHLHTLLIYLLRLSVKALEECLAGRAGGMDEEHQEAFTNERLQVHCPVKTLTLEKRGLAPDGE